MCVMHFNMIHPWRQALELNTRIQQQNAAPVGFPAFVREGFNVKVQNLHGSAQNPEMQAIAAQQSTAQHKQGLHDPCYDET